MPTYIPYWRPCVCRCLPFPAIMTPATRLREAFAGDAYLPRHGFLNYAIEGYPMRIIGLDTLTPGEGGGAVCSERLCWIDNALAAAPDQPTLVLMHHPPFITGIRRMDQIGLDGSAALAEVIRR